MAVDQTSFLPIPSPDSTQPYQPIPEHPPAGPSRPVRTESEPSRAAAHRDEFLSPEPDLESVATGHSVPDGCMITITPSDQYRSDLQQAAQALRLVDTALAEEAPNYELALLQLTEAYVAIDGLQQSMGCRQDPVVARLMNRYFTALERIPEGERHAAGDALLQQIDHFIVERADGGVREFRFSEGVVAVIDIDPPTVIRFTEINPPPVRIP